ncbi:MAG: hypothetical protein RLO52_47025 [Sandaracinaceae bacterium]|nr:MAG: hypothetical protein EVA89_37535 [Sandaracinaceae bacterium]HBQ12693.1 hypothetical protein [Myxococcales bacterium]
MQRSPLSAIFAALLLAPLLLSSSLGCGPSSTHTGGGTTAAEVRTLDEGRALELITQVLAEEAVARGPAWSVEIAPETALDVDVRLASSSFGIEWVSPQDRADLGDALPQPAPDGQLRIVPGTGEAAGAQVLLLEHSVYEFVNEREHVQSGAPGARETEVRLHRDVRDFLQYVRGQGGL